MTHYNEVTQIPGVNDHLHVINLLVKVDNLYGAVFISDGTDALEFFKYSIVLIDEKDSSVKVDINLIGTRTTKDEPFSYEFSFSDSNIFVDSQVKIAHTVFEPIFKLYVSFNEPSINEFIKLSKKLIAKFLKLDNHWHITPIPEIILQNYYLHYYNPKQHIIESIDYFQSRYEIISAFNYKKTELFLNNKFWFEFPDELWLLDQLHVLSIERTAIYKLPDNIRCLSCLRELIIANNHNFEAISPEIVNLKELTHLYLHDNNIKFLPEFIGKLNNLKILNLSFNHLRSLPASITSLNNLESLNISYNPIKSLPDGIFEMPNLRELNILHCYNLDLDYIYRKLINNNKIKIYS